MASCAEIAVPAYLRHLHTSDLMALDGSSNVPDCTDDVVQLIKPCLSQNSLPPANQAQQKHGSTRNGLLFESVLSLF